MNDDELISRIKQKENVDELISQVIKNPELIKALISTIETDKSSIKFGCEKVVRLVSEKRPELVYQYFDFFVKLLDSDNSFLRWGAIITISNLASADSKNKFERIFDKYYAPVSGPVMVTAANILGNSWKIAQAKPKLAGRVVDEILKVEKAKYIYNGKVSPECKNVACGSAIESLEKIFNTTKNQEKIIAFMKKQLKNTRPSVRKQAERFMKKLSE